MVAKPSIIPECELPTTSEETIGSKVISRTLLYGRCLIASLIV